MWPVTNRRMRDSGDSDELLCHRIVRLDGEITDSVAETAIAKLLYLEAEQPLEPINLLIKSAGGRVAAGMAIVDTLRTIRSPVRTRSAEEAHGMALIVLASGQRGERAVRASTMLSMAPIEAEAGSQADISGIRSQLANEFTKLSALSSEEIAKQLLTGKYLTPAEAVMFGFVDRIEA